MFLLLCLPVEERQQCIVSYSLLLGRPGCSGNFSCNTNPVAIGFVGLMSISRCGMQIIQTPLFLLASLGNKVTITCWPSCYHQKLGKSPKLLIYRESSLKAGFHWHSVAVNRFYIQQHHTGLRSWHNLLLLALLVYLSHIGTSHRPLRNTGVWGWTASSDPELQLHGLRIWEYVLWL